MSLMLLQEVKPQGHHLTFQVKSGDLEIQGGIYDLGTGRVQLLGLTIFCVLPELCSRDVIDRGSLARALRRPNC